MLTVSAGRRWMLQVAVPEGLGPGDAMEVWVSDEEQQPEEEDAAPVTAAQPQAHGSEDVVPAQADISASPQGPDRPLAAVTGAVEKAREQLRNALCDAAPCTLPKAAVAAAPYSCLDPCFCAHGLLMM